MARGIPGSGKAAKGKVAVAVAPAPEKKKRGGAKGPRRPAATRLKEVREIYDRVKEDTARRLSALEQKMAVLETQAAREEDVVSIRKRYIEKSDEEINLEYQEALRKISEIKRIRKG